MKLSGEVGMLRYLCVTNDIYTKSSKKCKMKKLRERLVVLKMSMMLLVSLISPHCCLLSIPGTGVLEMSRAHIPLIRPSHRRLTTSQEADWRLLSQRRTKCVRSSKSICIHGAGPFRLLSQKIQEVSSMILDHVYDTASP